MAYSPPLSYQSSCTLRRLAWALKIPMTQALEEVIHYITKIAVINPDASIVVFIQINRIDTTKPLKLRKEC